MTQPAPAATVDPRSGASWVEAEEPHMWAAPRDGAGAVSRVLEAEHLMGRSYAAQAVTIAGLVRDRAARPSAGRTATAEVQTARDSGVLSASEEIAAELALACRWSPTVARDKVDRAVALVERLPAAVQALADGLLDVAGARALAEETRHLDRDMAGDVCDRVLKTSAGLSSARVRAAARRVVGELAERDARVASQCRDRRVAAQAHRDVYVVPREDGMMALSGHLLAEDAIRCDAVLTHTARQLQEGDRREEGVARSLGQARADAFRGLILGELKALPAPRRMPRLTIVVSLAALVDHIENADLPAGLPGSEQAKAEQAVALMAGGPVRMCWLVTDDAGHAVALSESVYRPKALLRRAIAARDKTCRFADCDEPARRCDVDHLIPFPRGATIPSNLILLCRFHHRVKTHGEWTGHGDPASVVHWSSTQGHQGESSPHVYDVCSKT